MKPMITHYPDYYKDFKCIASACRHTCCAGWEIDVDDVSLERFRSCPDIMSHMEGNSITLDSNERCPFLREDGLCEIIIKHGENFICDICREHPRFYNCYEDHYEAGLGLVCEEACRIILQKEDDFFLEPTLGLSDSIKTVFDTTKSLSKRLEELKEVCLSPSERASFIKTLEVLDPVWTTYIERIITNPPDRESEVGLINYDSRRFSNFCAYLLYRYPGEDGFAAESTYLIADLVLTGVDILEAARMFSGEIEYSDINIDKAIEFFN